MLSDSKLLTFIDRKRQQIGFPEFCLPTVTRVKRKKKTNPKGTHKQTHTSNTSGSPRETQTCLKFGLKNPWAWLRYMSYFSVQQREDAGLVGFIGGMMDGAVCQQTDKVRKEVPGSTASRQKIQFNQGGGSEWSCHSMLSFHCSIYPLGRVLWQWHSILCSKSADLNIKKKTIPMNIIINYSRTCGSSSRLLLKSRTSQLIWKEKLPFQSWTRRTSCLSQQLLVFDIH